MLITRATGPAPHAQQQKMKPHLRIGKAWQ